MRIIVCLLEAIKGLNPNWLPLLLKLSKQSPENVVKTWSRIKGIDEGSFSEDSGKSINFDSHSI